MTRLLTLLRFAGFLCVALPGLVVACVWYRHE